MTLFPLSFSMLWLLQETVGGGFGSGGIVAGGAALTGLGMTGMLKGGAFSHGLSGFMNNPLVQGGLVMGILMWAWNLVKSSPSRLIAYIKSRMIVTITAGDSESKHVLMEWFAQHPYGKKAKNILLDTDWERGRSRPLIQTGPGDHVIRYKKHRIWLKIERKDKKPNTGGYGDDFDQLNITINAFRGGRAFIEDFIQEVWRYHNKDLGDRILVEKFDGHWNIFGMTERRPVSSLVFANNIPENIIQDIKQFEAEKQWYKDMDISHTRGFLLYGEPGNGKTSLVRAIATELDKSLATFSMTDAFTDAQLLWALTNIPKNSILLIEDVDAIFAKPPQSPVEESDECVGGSDYASDTAEPELSRTPVVKVALLYNRKLNTQGISFSGVLNALDGVMTSHSRIVFMTTNRKEVLDAALIRPGRVDKAIYIGNATQDQIRRFYTRFFPSDSPDVVEAFVQQYRDGEKSMAEIQELLLNLKERRRQQFLPEQVNT